MMVSITFSRTPVLPIQAESLRSHALYLIIEHVHFFSAPFVPGLGCIGAAQFFQRFLDGEFGCFSHGKPHIQTTPVETRPSVADKIGAGRPLPPSAPACCLVPTASDPPQASVDLDQHEE
jgi:hypothetical protein